MKKISAIILSLVITLNFFCFVNFAEAAEYKSCCVCSITKTYAGGAGPEVITTKEIFAELIVSEQCVAKQDELSTFGRNVGCNIVEDKDCGTKTMTKIEEDFVFKDVVLGVTIPSLHFSAPPTEVDEEGNIYIPWFGEYIKAVYNFAVATISIVAVVVIIIQGAVIITSAGGPTKQQGYKRITQAVIGLLIAWGSYVVLYTINPNLTTFRSLKIQFIPESPLHIELQTTLANTSEGIGEPVSGSFQPQYTECPLQLSGNATAGQPEKDPRSLSFYDKAESLVTGEDTLQLKIIKIADAAVKCGVNFGACGRTAGTIYTLAGIGSKDCLSENKGCWTKGRVVNSVPQADRKYLQNVKCSSQTPASSCASDNAMAKKMVYDYYKAKLGSSWPDAWANALQPGDYIIVYNGNSSLRGTHAALFVGWGSGGKAQVIQGSYGKTVSQGSICILSTCPNPAALIEVTRP